MAPSATLWPALKRFLSFVRSLSLLMCDTKTWSIFSGLKVLEASSVIARYRVSARWNIGRGGTQKTLMVAKTLANITAASTHLPSLSLLFQNASQNIFSTLGICTVLD